MASEQTYIMVKPDGVQRGIYIEVLKRFQQKGFTLKAMKMVNVTKEHAESHYADLSSKPFFPALVEYMTSGPVIAMVCFPVHVLNQALAVLECLQATEWTRRVDTASSDRMGTPQVWEGKNVVLTGRKLIGATDPAKSEPGTIRGDFCIVMGRNIIHGSDAVESAQHEINLWFPEGAPLLAAREAVWALRCGILASAPFGGDCFQSTVLPATAVFQDCNSKCLGSQIQAPRCLAGLKMLLASVVLVPCPGALAALCTL